jgi:hypothetical protein
MVSHPYVHLLPEYIYVGMDLYPYMRHVFSYLASTYRPPELGSAEVRILNIFAKSNSQSAYGILKVLKRYVPHSEKGPGYKDVHKRVKRLLQLNLIYQTENQFERGAKHYKITPYGLIASLDKDIFRPLLISGTAGYENVICNTDNIVIQSLLIEFFCHQQTINNFDKLPNSLATDLMGYLHDCCSYATDACRQFRGGIERHKITDILPSDEIIQKYMAHIDGGPAEEHVLNEIKEYEERLKKKLDGNIELAKAARVIKEDKSTDTEDDYESSLSDEMYDFKLNLIPGDKKPPFPLGDMYVDIVCRLNWALEEKTRSLIFNFVRLLGEEIGERIASGEKPSRLDDIDSISRRHSFDYVVADKRFMGLVNSINKDFDAGRERLNALKERLTREWV